MIRHIVLFKIKDEFKDEIPQLVKNFEGMRGRIKGHAGASGRRGHTAQRAVLQ